MLDYIILSAEDIHLSMNKLNFLDFYLIHKHHFMFNILMKILSTNIQSRVYDGPVCIPGTTKMGRFTKSKNEMMKLSTNNARRRQIPRM